MQILIVIFLAVTVLWLTYWALVRPVILDSVQDEYRRMRSELDWAIIEGLPQSQSQPAQALANRLMDSTAIRWVSLGQAFVEILSNKPELKAAAAREKEIFDSSPSWIRNMKDRDNELAVKAALANSPLWWLPISTLLVVAVFSRQVATFWFQTKIATKELQADRSPACSY